VTGRVRKPNKGGGDRKEEDDRRTRAGVSTQKIENRKKERNIMLNGKRRVETGFNVVPSLEEHPAKDCLCLKGH